MEIIFLDKDWNPVPREQAAFAKVRADDGTISFAFPPARKQYHLAGTDQDHDQSTHAPNKDGGDSKGKFFSPLKRALDLAKQNKAPGRDWASILSKAQGVTKDELAATGILDWLKGKGTEQVTKAELQKFASDHAVEIRPVVLGGSHPNADALNRESSDLYARWGELQRSRESGMPDKEWQEISAKMIAIEERRREIGNELNRTPATKYEQYTLPGAENYREVLLTLAGRSPVDKWTIVPSDVENRDDVHAGEVDVIDHRGKVVYSGMPEDAQAYIDESRQLIKGEGQFHTTHFDQPNIVAHLRIDDRVDVDGNKVLFIEELQSDWAQAGRKDGFKGEFPQDILKAAIAGGMSEEQAIADINHLLKEPLDTEDRRTVAQWSALTNAVEKGGMSSTRLNEVFHDRRDHGVPLAPFVTDTQAWVGLAMKHAMTEAVDGGYNAVAWTTGAQQNERYNLAKAVDELEYIPSINRLIGWKDRASAVSETVTPDKLDDYVGKELAQKLLATPLNSSGRHVLGGEGLKVGGEGMKSFYDSLVPSVAGKLIRKNDPEAKVGAIKLVFERLDKTGSWNDETSQPGFYITPKMREQLRRGISLFEAEELHSHKFEKREPNKYERRVDYAKIEKSLDALIAEGGLAARKALVAAEKRHLDLIVARLDSKLSADDVAALRIDTGAVVLGTFDQLLHDAWRLGVEHTYHEHPGHAESLRARQFAGLEPEAAMRYFRARALDMKGIIDDDLTEATKQELLMFLKGARSIPESIDNIRRIFEPFVGDPTKIQPSGQIGIGFPPGEMGPENVLMAYRLENIIRTPTTEAYNQGRLAVGDEMEEFVVGYAYSALLDERTTEICQFLDQFMLRKDDPALRKLTPPNHFQCRSILVFITQEDLPVEFTDPETIDEGIRIVQAGFK